MNRTINFRLTLLALALAPMASRAALIEAPAGNAVTQLRFDAHPTEEFTLGPVALTAADGRDVVFTAMNSFGSAGFSGDRYGLGDNGAWTNAGRTYAWANGGDDGGASSWMRFTFANGPVSCVGGFMNYVPSIADDFYYASDFVLKALGSNGSVLEQYALKDDAPIVTTGEFDAGAYRGISRSTADIYAFEIQGAGVLEFLDLSSTPAVPEPSTTALLLAGLGALGLARPRRLSRR